MAGQIARTRPRAGYIGAGGEAKPDVLEPITFLETGRTECAPRFA